MSSWRLTATRCARKLNSIYFLGLLPLLHILVCLAEMTLAARLTSKFNAQYARRPIMTMMVTNAILGGVADTVAQVITAYRQRPQADSSLPSSLTNPTSPTEDISPWDLELNEKSGHGLDTARPSVDPRQQQLSSAPRTPFDFERLSRFVAYGFVMAPVQFRWFKLLESVFPLTKTSAIVPALKRVAFDQGVFAPFGIVCFFSFMTFAEGGRMQQLRAKFRDLYLPTLGANYVVWPAIQIINFRWMPVQFQLPFVSTISIAWTAYLSLTNSASEEVSESALGAGEMRI